MVNLTKEDLWNLSNPDKVRVPVSVSYDHGFALPDENGEHEETAYFSVYTVGDNMVIEKACSYEQKGIERNEPSTTVIDVNEMRRLWVRKNLINWTLDIPIERDNGWMTEDSYERASSVPAPLMEAFLDGFERSFAVTEEDDKKIDRQSVILFGKNAGGVSGACEAVSRFCTLGNFWEKFGMNDDNLPDLPFRDFTMLRMMINNESKYTKMNMGGSSPKSNTRIAGPGGKIRQSRGTVIRG